MKTAAVREHEPLSATRHTNLLRLLNPRSIAVVGASADRSKAGSQALQYEYRAVNLRREEHLTPEYRRLNPQGLVPALVVEGRVMTQTPAIIEWIEETWPHPPLLPRDAQGRAQVRAMAAIVGCDNPSSEQPPGARDAAKALRM